MNNILMKTVAVSLAALLIVWIAAAWYIDAQTKKAEEEWQTRREALQRYETLKTRWSSPAQRAALKKFETMLRLYGITPKVKKIRDRKTYTFTLSRQNADKVMSKLLNAPLALASLRVERLDDARLQVTVGVRI